MAAESMPKGDENSPTMEVPLVEEQDGSQLSKSLHRLETFLRLFGYCQYSFLSFVISWLSFLLLGIVLPVFMIKLSASSKAEKYQINSFEFQILVFQSLAAAISLLCISHNLRKYGVRNFLFVDRSHGHMAEFRDEYVKKIHDFFFLVAVWVLPCLLLKIVLEIVRDMHVHRDPWWQTVAISIAHIISWTYSTIIFLSGCALFNLLCNLQVIHFENYGKLLERDMDVLVYIEEHIRLTHYLSKISHRFRIFFILEILVVTACQAVALFQTTGNKDIITLMNGGDFVISCIAELVGIIITLHAAAKTTHRAQGVASIAAKWHSLVTSNSRDAAITSSSGNLDPPNMASILHLNYSESDLEAVDYVPVPTIAQLTSSYNKRQAFVSYLQSNPGGFSVFGWMIERPLINTIFFLEISLVLFVLGKTITFTSK
ncbi:hypothetical protein P3X46_023495 [Hevea brasiliensis]|uniref:Uncharacterized protein n=1 Tax=Hevea brasiliensis TaxID=3981 RepID=A0ABQ9LB41_HEVBR|nr:uncharacterized protein LOC110634029 [Hevea brasiliensis]KAJ9163868.1 hypothetical protein P3X46_023495 [Hevea brasiliensis]